MHTTPSPNTSHPTSPQGIVFSVRPPKKSWKHIANLSGGEKTLSSLALVFALHHYKPTPLYVMDEIDAALDFKNVSIGGCKGLYQGTGFEGLGGVRRSWGCGLSKPTPLHVGAKRGVRSLEEAHWVF